MSNSTEHERVLPTSGSQRGLLPRGWLAAAVVILILAIDQIIKIVVKTNMCLHESLRITDWFYICFIENNGMAWGMTFINKLMLSLFRIVAVCFIAYYIRCQVRAKTRRGYIICLSMVLAGAVGNIIDCIFYGQIFTMSTPYSVSTIVNFGDGYAPILMGKVVDMFYFPLIQTTIPSWMPFCGGEPFVFFSPVFNFADACITVGFALLLIFFRNELATITVRKKKEKENEPAQADENDIDAHA